MSALKHLFIYYYDYNLLSTVPNLVIHHFCVLIARHVSVNQECPKKWKHPLNICKGTWKGDLFSGLSEITETAHLCSIQSMQLSVKLSFTQLSLQLSLHPLSQNLHLSLCVCVQCSVNLNGCIHVVSILSVTDCFAPKPIRKKIFYFYNKW